MSGVGRLFAALAVSSVPADASSGHPFPLSALWRYLAGVSNMQPHTDVTATLLLEVLEVAGSSLLSQYGPQFLKLLRFLHTAYLPLLDNVKSDGGPTNRLEQFLTLAIKSGSIRAPEGILGVPDKSKQVTLFS